MLQPAASSAQSSLLLNLGAKGGSAENLEISEGFAAFLAIGMPIGGEEGGDADVKSEANLSALLGIAKVTGKANGNAGGKILPLVVPDDETAVIKSIAAIEAQPNELAKADDSLAPTSQISAEPTLAILAAALPNSTPAADTPQIVTTQLPPAATPSKILEQTVTLEGDEPSPDNPTRGETVMATKQPAEPLQHQAAVPSQKQLRPDVALAQQLTVAPEAQKLAAGPVRSAPQTGAVDEKAAAAGPAQPAKATVHLSISLPREPAAARTAELKVSRAAEATAAILNTDDVEPGVTKVVAAPAVRSAPQPASAVRVREAEVTNTKSATVPSLAAIANATINDPIGPTGAELQPVLAMRDAQALTTGSATPLTLAPASAAQHSGHDFAALVDRLVEARDAAMPQTIRTAIQHADFGQVSLNFRTGDSHLSVSMTSADPDFAPTVQAAAAMQANTSADSGTSSQRQDAQGQQAQSGTATSGQAQTQSQGSARGGERERGEPSPRSGNTESAQARDDAQPASRGGIYA